MSTLYGWHVHSQLLCGKMPKRNAFRLKPFVVQPLCLGIFNMQRYFFAADSVLLSAQSTDVLP